MAFKLTNCKEVALKSFIHVWLKDPQLYCNWCGNVYVPPPEGSEEIPCCERMQIGTNLTITHALLLENKMLRETRANEFASNKDKTMRWGLSMPPRLLHDLEEYSINTLKEPLFKDDKEMMDFSRAFPQFAVCKKI